jgi:NagD protein
MMIGDRMDTDIIAGVESGMMTTLVLSGVTKVEEIDKYPYRPMHVLDSIADLVIE